MRLSPGRECWKLGQVWVADGVPFEDCLAQGFCIVFAHGDLHRLHQGTAQSQGLCCPVKKQGIWSGLRLAKAET